jgi:hypothetical protein
MRPVAVIGAGMWLHNAHVVPSSGGLKANDHVVGMEVREEVPHFRKA